jgi:hypothetical protein
MFQFCNMEMVPLPLSLNCEYICRMAPDSETNSQRPALPKVAHELNNELGIIMAQCDLLEDLLRNVPSASAHLNIIREATRRMAERITSCAWPGIIPSGTTERFPH